MQEIDLGGAGTVRVPTPAEALRILPRGAAQPDPGLSDPSPRDRRTTTRLTAYQNLHARWHNWADVVAASQVVADDLLKRVEGDLE